MTFRNVKNDSQKILYEGIEKVQTSKKTLNPADKSSNMHRLDKNECQNLLGNNIAATYKRRTNINKEDIKFAKQADILDRLVYMEKKIEINRPGNSFVTLKNLKENFMNYPTTWLINSFKNDIGKISKHILDQIN